jgi:hypothetical protein
MLVEPVAGILKQHPFSTAVCAVLIAGAAGLWSVSTYRSPPKFAPDALLAQQMCAAWDEEASRGTADLIFDTSATAEWRLDQALLQLRRARKHCRSGAVQVAYHDYASLHRGFPLLANSISAAAQSQREGALQPAPSGLMRDK